ncbi:MAG: phenylalanine--tRNA ligase subunit alpha [Candidatus Cloacimonetes bacterium]|nr:phenylalanine--tRNA ligase subunit alpha [Candidatus Cloacimonadota bacterium]MDD4156032.1 phenylalanine--tRNA ligase subunit alpha [Candidatus Cloacimonadota bacterium]
MKEELHAILKQAEEDLKRAQTFFDLNNLKSRFVGKKSVINQFMKRLGSLSPEERPAFGKQINDVKTKIESIIKATEERINSKLYEQSVKAASFDYTMPARPSEIGSLHPISIIQHQIEDVMISMGFQVAEGFDVEDEFHNFDALNTPKDHPARNLADTFFIEKDVLLRTQTSTVQIRVMENYKPPLKIISPGRCYRNDKFDQTHSPVFHQLEALVVDENISFKDLKETLNHFAVRMFGTSCKTRFRPHFFPFTEPSAEMDVSCFNCGGKGCSTCKNSGWIEIAGAGMVDPNVFDAIGIDSEKYTGFAFGCGIDRITMQKFCIPDIRFLFENDLRFLRQFNNFSDYNINR